MQSIRGAEVVAGATLVVMWSSGFVGAALGTRYAAPDTLLAWRYLVASAVLLVALAYRRVRLSGRAVARQAVVGLLCQVGYLGGVVTGVGLGVAAGTAALVAALQPLLVAALAGPVLGERIGRAQLAGLLAGLAGVALVVSDDVRLGAAPAWVYLLPFAGMVALSAGTLWQRRLRAADPLPEALALQSAAWTVVLSSFGGYGSYLLVLRQGGATRVSTLLYLTPPTTTLWAFWMFGESPGALAVVGMAVCATGVYLALRPRRRPVPEPRQIACRT
jgi:drug/metabolite transporter (DMT)-like permease